MWNRRKIGHARLTSHKRTELAGHWFDSKAESEMFLVLSGWLDEGKITDIKRQQLIKLTAAKIGYKADFIITYPDGSLEAVEFKGFESEVFLLKKKLYRFYGPFRLSIYKKRGKQIYLDEVIDPEVVNEKANQLSKKQESF